MKTQEIERLTIEKAIKRGYEKGGWAFSMSYSGRFIEVIFSHEFAKAFWGEINTTITLPAWKYHLQEMVIQKDRLKYLKKFLEDTDD